MSLRPCRAVLTASRAPFLLQATLALLPALLAAAVAAGWASRGFAASSSSSSLESSSSRRLSESRRLREALAEHSETLAGIERGISVRKKREHTKKEPFQLARTS